MDIESLPCLHNLLHAGEKGVAVKANDAGLQVEEGELDASSLDHDQAGEFDDDEHYRYRYGHRRGYWYRHRPRWGYRRHCRFYCGRFCCSAEEYTEFMQDQN